MFQRRPTEDGERNVLIWNLTTKWHNFTHCAFKCTDSLHGQKSLLVPDALFWSYSCGICSAHNWGNWQSSEWGTWCLTYRLNDKEKKKSFEIKCDLGHICCLWCGWLSLLCVTTRLSCRFDLLKISFKNTVKRKRLSGNQHPPRAQTNTHLTSVVAHNTA